MKNVLSIERLFFSIILTISMVCNASHAAENNRPGTFRIPVELPRTQYAIELNVDASSNRAEGHEKIRIVNSSPCSLKSVVMDWPYLSSEDVKLLSQGKPLEVLVKGGNGLSKSQILVELPQPLRNGESVTVEIQFGFPLRLGKINKLETWHPRLWWGRNTSDDYEVKVNAPEGYLIATSGVFDENLNGYTAKGCRKFGVVFMKDLKVLKGQSGDTKVYSYYDEGSRECVEFTHQTALEVIDFYRDWLGFYPHKILHILPGGLSHPAGGYPIATAIVGIHGQKQMKKAPKTHWQYITAHEIGHQYCMEHVMEAPNTFWLMIGLGVYADRAFMLAKGYGDQHERDMIGRYVRGTRDLLDTRMDRLPEEMEEVDFDYNNVVDHGKGFGVISALACLMGKDKFETAYKRSLEEFKGRTLGVGDFQRVCEEVSGETLDWFFDQWVRTSRFLSYKIASRETTSKQGNYVTTARIRKLGTLRMPVPVTAIFEDGSSQCLYTDRLLDECSLVFTSKSPLNEIKLDANGELPLVVPPPDPQMAQFKKAIRSLRMTGEGDKAHRIFTQTKDTDFDDAGSYFRLGMCLFDGEFYEEALQTFRKCFEFGAEDSHERFLGLVWQGHLLDLLNRREDAIACYKQALQHCDSGTDVRHDQYGMRITQSWVEQRIRSPFQRPAPKIIEVRNRIRNLEWTGEGDKALQLFNEVKNVKTDGLELPWGKLALCLYDGKHYPEALQAFQNDFAQNPTSYSSLVWQGHLLDLLNHREEALSCYKQALEHWDADSWVRHDQYGMKLDRDWIKQRIESPFQRTDPQTINQTAQQETLSEPRLCDVLKNMGYDDSVIEHPLSVALFKSVAPTSVRILQKNGNADVSFGWYQEDQKHLLFEQIAGSTQPKTFDPGEAHFGFFIHVDFAGEYQWYTDISKNDGEAHVKVYPLVKEGKEIPDSYLLCWEDLPLGSEENDDYQDIIVYVSGVSPVKTESFGSLYGDFPRLSFHIWGSTPFSSRLTSNPTSQRILFCIRKDSKRPGEIADEVKASVERVLTSLSKLAEYDLVRETSDSKWVANFPIHTEEGIRKANQVGLKYGRIEADILRDHIPDLRKAYEQCQVSKYHPWPKTSLIVVGALCADFCVSDRIRFRPEYFDERFLPPLHPDGRRWGYSGEEVLSSPLPFRKYQFYQNVFQDREGGVARFGYYYLLDEQRQSPPSRPESLRDEPEGKIWLSLTEPSTVLDIQRKTGLSPAVIQPAIDKMSIWNPPGVIKQDDRYLCSIPILSSADLKLLLPETDRISEIIFKQITVPMESELEEEGKRLGLRFPLPSGTSARDIALQILGEEGLLPIAQPPVPWNFGVWGWNGHLKMWEDPQ